MIIQKQIPLQDKNWFQTGGPARFYCQPTTIEEFQEALKFANIHKLEIEILGQGANVLINDNGFDGLVIKPFLNKIIYLDKKKKLVTAQSGATIQQLIDWSLKHNLLGLEEFSGIPGSIGGAIYMNIHYSQFFIANFLEKAQIINKKTGEIITVNKSWFNFDYDASTLHKKEYLLVNATFQLYHATDIETAYARGKSDERIKQRNSRYPTSHTCGCFFKNFTKDEIQSKQQIPYVSYYLDQLGIKGKLKVGDAMISHLHANMIVNNGNATSKNIVELAQKMQTLVQENFGLLPQPECQFIGFKKQPLS